LKIIPLQEFTAHDPPPLSLDEALSQVKSGLRSGISGLFTDDQMNRAIIAKVKTLAQELPKQRHIAKVMLPRLLAQVIHRNPQTIASGVQGFYTRTTQFKVL
jgi:hypothetical protein